MVTEERLKEIFEGVKVQIGLRQQGHMDTVIKMIRDAASWEEIGAAIGWHSSTAQDWYIAESAAQLLAYRDSGALARSIAEALFTNGSGEKAERLVLELPGKRDGGGWCRAAVEGVIERKLEAING